MSETADWKRLDGALSLGLSRQPLPPLAGAEGLDEPARALAVLTLLGQRARLAEPRGLQGLATGSRLPDDPRPMLDPKAREALLRLDRRLDAESRRRLAPLVLAAIGASGQRLHPFDLPNLDALLRQGGTALGPVERAWLGWTGASAPGASDPEGGAADRLGAFRQARRKDPAAAREALAFSLSSEPAKLRAELVGSLGVGLSPDDAQFLNTCLGDRAQSVREAATALLARLPGAPAYEDRLALARACLGVETKGLLRKIRRLTFKPPSGDRHAAATLFQGFGLSSLIDGLGFEPLELPEAAAGIQPALPLLARAALLDGEPALAAAFLTRLEDPVWPADLLRLPLDAQLLNGETRQTVLSASLTHEVRFDPLLEGFNLAEFLDGPMSRDLAERLIASQPWRRWLNDVIQLVVSSDRFDPDPVLLRAVAAMPWQVARAVTDALAAIPPARQPKTAAYLAFLARLAAPSKPSEPSETPVV
ncbi:DUF5691 domain-containing protein [Caulobacter sp. HMWF025]|uniref:DUF5691 domain-containing protein n=3 Tax=unclassified Caulobacter TaxID=2648921 RepID=UPI0011B1F3DB|nr:DUF5691 domain-containing protein [Caulobacter sp. HMWF025]